MLTPPQRTSLITVITAITLLAGCEKKPELNGIAPPTKPEKPQNEWVMPSNADVLYYGGTIITMNDEQPIAEAIALNKDRIIAVGSKAEIDSTFVNEDTTLINLNGRALLPGFIDAHSHYISSLSIAHQVNLYSPPSGPGSDVDSIIQTLVKYQQDNNVPFGEWIQAYGYDENVMPEGRLLNRGDLDAYFPNNPVFVGHVSMHGAVVNSQALELAGINKDTPTPEGGIIVRNDQGEPWGLIMETAYEPIVRALPQLKREDEIANSIAGQYTYAKAGITTAHEGATMAHDLALMQRVSEANANIIDIVAYPFITELDKVLENNPVDSWGEYNKGLKIGGVKITGDGSPQGKTAYFSIPYLTGGPAGEDPWRGEPTFDRTTLTDMVKRVYELGVPLNYHANGDAAIDLLLDIHASITGDYAEEDRDVTVIHSQFVRKDQIARYKTYRFRPSLYTLHTYYFADAHLKNRGFVETQYISPMRDAIDAGLVPTNHTDFVVAPLDQMFMLWSAVNRLSRDGDPIGPEQRVTVWEGLKAMTINGAEQYNEADLKGSLEPGKLADIVILSDNPMNPDLAEGALRNIQIVETIKEGKRIYPQ